MSVVLYKLYYTGDNPKNVIYERAMFHQRMQQNSEQAESFIRSLYEMAEHCDFGASKDDCIRDRLVVGIPDKELSERLQLKEKLVSSQGSRENDPTVRDYKGTSFYARGVTQVYRTEQPT